MNTEFNAGVYCIINLINRKKYAGSSVDIKNRWHKHKSDLKRGCHDNPYLQREFNKYGEDAFDFRVLVYTDPEEALPLEQFILDNYLYLFEYNIAKNATAPMLGRKHSEEAKVKMSNAKMGENHPNFGKTLPEETRSKISEAHAGKTLSEKHKQKISESRTGTHHAKETKRKISESNSGDKCYKWIDIPDEKIDEMQSLRAQGYSYRKIENILGVSDSTVRKRLNSASKKESN